jgi:hypothetical protein
VRDKDKYSSFISKIRKNWKWKIIIILVKWYKHVWKKLFRKIGETCVYNNIGINTYLAGHVLEAAAFYVHISD